MENDTGAKVANSRLVPRGSFARWKEKPPHANAYLDFLAHYDAELMRINGTVTVVRHATGAELPLEQKGKLIMVKLLLDEFGTVDGINKAIEDYRDSRP
jgi:hypothetical protein